MLAFLFPSFGTADGPLRTNITTKLGVVIIFLLQGLSLPTRAILRSAANWKLNLFCQSWIFLGSPLLMLGLLWSGSQWIDPDLKIALIYLAVLPTTISSAVALTTSSEGDISGALFNTSFANVLGVFLTPLWCFTLIKSTSGEFPPIGPLLLKLALLILLPLVIGQLIRPFFRQTLDNLKGSFKEISTTIVAFIVYASFCKSVAAGTWERVTSSTLLLYLAVCISFLLIVSLLVWITSSIALSTAKERIAGFFCASQKSLATGAPMAAIIFSTYGSEQASLILVPLLCYHTLQLLLGGLLSHPFAALTHRT